MLLAGYFERIGSVKEEMGGKSKCHGELKYDGGDDTPLTTV